MRDTFHSAVRHALEKAGWTITHDPYPLPFGETTMQVDLGAENVLGAAKGQQLIAVEIKSFISNSAIHELQSACGQYLVYLEALAIHEPEREIWLAVPVETWNTLFAQAAIKGFIAKYQIRVIVYEIDQEIIEAWIH